MENIINTYEAATGYIPPGGAVVHRVDASLDSRGIYAVPCIIHVVQYDYRTPIIAVQLLANSQPYAVPEGAYVNIRMEKPDGKNVYNQALGLSDDRSVVYIAATRQMTAAAGRAEVIVEIATGDGLVGTSKLVLEIDRNPIQESDITSLDEYKTIWELAAEVEATAGVVRDNIGAINDVVENLDDIKAAPGAASAAADSATEAASSANAAKNSKEDAEKFAIEAESWAHGGTGTRGEEEETDNAKAHADRAGKSAGDASTSAKEAAKSEGKAAEHESTAEEYKNAASESSASAAGSAAAADKSAKGAAANKAATELAAENAEYSSKMAKSYAVGGSGLRDGEDTDSAQYYYDQVRRIAGGVTGGGLVPMGTIPPESLQTVEKQPGYMYNIADKDNPEKTEFMTDDSFLEGAGHTYPMGTNVYWTGEGYWDALAGVSVTGVKGDAETIYHVGNVSISAEDVGAYSKKKTEEKIAAATSQAWTLPVPASAWEAAEDESSPAAKYKAEISAEGMTEETEIDIFNFAGGDFTAATQWDRYETGEGVITLWADYVRPEADFTLRIKEVR